MSSSSSDENDEAEATEQPKVLPDEESSAMVVTSISPTEHSVRPKLRAWRSYSGVFEAEAMEETRVATLTEPVRMSERNVPRPNYAELDLSRRGRTTPSQTVTTRVASYEKVAWYRPTRVTMARCPRLCLRQSRLAG